MRNSYWFLAHLVCLWLCSASISGYEADYCRISIAKPNTQGRCEERRQLGLAQQKKSFQLVPPTADMPFARKRGTVVEWVQQVKKIPFLAKQMSIYFAQSKVARLGTAKYQQMTAMKPEEMKYQNYEKMFHFYRSIEEPALGDQLRIPSKYELFDMKIDNYISDEKFAEQRLAGTNPLMLQRVTLGEDGVGLNWKELKKTLNPTFDWEEAIGMALDDEHFEYIEEMIEDHRVYALRYPLADDLEAIDDIIDKNPNRTLLRMKSPIALFVSKRHHYRHRGPSGKHGKHRRFLGGLLKGFFGYHRRPTYRLVPVAIQMDYKKDSKVYTPRDRDLWKLAKLNVQLTDFGYGQIVWHLGRTHLVPDSICVSMERHLSYRHPLYAMLKYHCRGVLTSATIGGNYILTPRGIADVSLAFGLKGVKVLLTRSAKTLTWDGLDFDTDIKKRGIDVEELSYYPYRDDGKKLVRVIQGFIEDYVALYYKGKEEIKKDAELQAFFKEISLAGNGKITGFPTAVDSREQLSATLSRFLWLVTGLHACVNFPIADYAFIPALPTKLYYDNRVPNDTFSLLNLPQRSTAEKTMEFWTILSNMRFDRFLDYGEELEDEAARRVVKRHFCKLNEELEPHLNAENKWRYDNGLLTYPYFLPRWMPNGVQI